MFVTTEIFATFDQACQVEKRKSVLIYSYVLLFTWLHHTVIPPFSVFYDFWFIPTMCIILFKELYEYYLQITMAFNQCQFYSFWYWAINNKVTEKKQNRPYVDCITSEKLLLLNQSFHVYIFFVVLVACLIAFVFLLGFCCHSICRCNLCLI